MPCRIEGSAPIVDDPRVGAVEAAGLRAQHGDALRGYPESVGEHAPLCILAREIYSGFERCSTRRCLTGQGERVAGNNALPN